MQTKVLHARRHRRPLAAFGLAAMIAMIFLSACKKETPPAPAFSAEGFWEGALYLHHVAMLNRGDGTSRFYLTIYNSDTSTATKFDGIFYQRKDAFSARYLNGADTIHFQSFRVSPTGIYGFATGITDGAAIPCELLKK